MNDVSFSIFESRIHQAVQIYEQALLTIDCKIERAKVGSINKNQSVCFKKLLENYKITGPQSVNDFIKTLKLMVQYQSQAIFNGKNDHPKKWYIQILESSTFIFENETVTDVFKSLEVQDQIEKYESILTQVNSLNFELVRRLSWNLSKLYYQQSIRSHENKQF